VEVLDDVTTSLVEQGVSAGLFVNHAIEKVYGLAKAFERLPTPTKIRDVEFLCTVIGELYSEVKASKNNNEGGAEADTVRRNAYKLVVYFLAYIIVRQEKAVLQKEAQLNTGQLDARSKRVKGAT